jgi:competence protein ComEC
VVALVGFVILVRPSPSVLRAAAMGGLGLLALATGRPRSAVPGLAAVIILLVLVDPQLAGEAGFALSVLATAGLLLIAPGWRDGLRRLRVPAGLAEAIAVPAAAQLACAPVIAALSGAVGLVAVPANLLAVPAVPPATVLGVAAALLSQVWPAGAELAARLAAWPARWPVLVRLAAVVTAAIVVGTLPIRIVASGWPSPGWLVVTCDVGQGDATVLAVAPGQAIVVDTGPEPAAVDGCLWRLGVGHVTLLVVSHSTPTMWAGSPGCSGTVPSGGPDHRPPGTGARTPPGPRRRDRPAYPGPRGDRGGGLHGRAGTVSVVGPMRPLSNTRSDRTTTRWCCGWSCVATRSCSRATPRRTNRRTSKRQRSTS